MDSKIKSSLYEFAAITLENLRRGVFDAAWNELGLNPTGNIEPQLLKVLEWTEFLQQLLITGKLSEEEPITRFTAELIANEEHVAPPFGKIENRFSPKPDEAESIRYELYRMMVAYIKDLGAIQFDGPKLVDVFHDFSEGWRDCPIEYRGLMPLVGIEPHFDEIVLTDDIALRRFTTLEKDHWWDSHVSRWQLKPWDYGRTDVFVEYYFQQDRVHRVRNWQRARTEAELAVSALKLFRRGNVGILGYFERPMGHYELHPHTTEQPGRHRAFEQDDPRHRLTLNKDDSDNYRNIVNALLDAEPEEQGQTLNLAIRRFDLSFGRTVPGDRIIDLFTALDAALKHSREGSVEIVNRVANLLGDGRKNEDIRQDVRTLRFVRNQVVHEGVQLTPRYFKNELPNQNEIKPSPILDGRPEHFLYYAQDLVRQVLRRCLLRVSEGKSMNDVRRSLS